ncbi:MAG: hypothetical protein JNM78_13415 [Cyclobacteriaceae bacterium]|nr:hypothetical protein [Cyclobacteriaceae bacterium]
MNNQVLRSSINKTLLGIFFIISSHSVISQDKNNANMVPNVAPPTPDIGQLGRFGNYPVNHFSGLVNISIPLYEVRVGEISVPISLSYHTSGIKVTDRSGWVGLGWALNTGGYISRTVMGMPDEAVNGYFSGTTIKQPSEINTLTEPGLLYLEDISKARTDTEPDIFSYNIGSHSGKVLFNQGSNFVKVSIPYDPVKIKKLYAPNSLSFEAWDVQGALYKYNILEKSSGMNDNVSTTSGWLPSKIISSNKQDTVNFSYSMTSGITYTDIIDKITVTDQTNNLVNNNHYTSNTGEWTIANVATYSEEQKLTEIKHPTGKVTFVAGEREDGWVNGVGTQKRLDKINIFSLDVGAGSYILIKSIKFYQSYFISTDGTNTKRLRLDSLKVLDNLGVQVQRYKFEYNTSITLPEYKSRRRDYWGYFNNAANTSLVPRMTIPWQSNGSSQNINIEIASNNPTNGREPDPTYMQGAILKKVVYPTGGWTEFDYETNRYLDVNNNLKYAGGLRVSQLRSYDGYSLAPIKQTIKYGTNESGVGRANFLLNNYFFQNSFTDRTIFWQPGLCIWEMATARMRTFISQPNLSIEPYDGSPVVYPVVTVYDGDETNNNGKTIYQYSDFPDQLNAGAFQTGTPAVYSYHCKRGLLLSEETYKKNSSIYYLIKSTTNQYSAFPDSSKIAMGMKVFKSIISNSVGPGTFQDSDVRCQPQTYNICGPTDSYSYQYSYYNVYTGDSKLISSVDKVFDQYDVSKFVATTTNYSYGNYLHQQVTQSSTTNSIGELLVKSINYPHESAGTVYSEMVQKHMISYPVEETTTLNGASIQKITRNFQKYFNDVYQPATLYRKIGTGSNDLETSITGYDIKSNMLGAISIDNVAKSYLWGYKNTVPIAEAINAVNNKNTTYIPVTGTSAINMAGPTPSVVLNKTITVANSGTVYLKLGVNGNPTYTTYASYSSATLGNASNITLAKNVSCGAAPTIATFTNVPAGSHTITITLTTPNTGVSSLGACGQIDFPDVTASITGITEFFFESFEENGVAGPSKPHTGKRYLAGDYTTTFAKPNARNYIIEYWYLNGTQWMFATAPYVSNMVLALGDAIDDVRIYPSDALMKSYVYEPGFGISAVINENGTILYYNYDTFGRLSYIKNDKGEIEKQYSYNYKN